MAIPLPNLLFARMADVSPAGTSIAQFLTALYTSLSGATDYRGTALPAANTWTWATAAGTVYTTSAPAGTPMTKSPQIIFSMATPAPALTFATPDTVSVADVLYAGINKNGGAYVSNLNPLPYGSGQFFGNWKASTIAALSASTVIRSFISQETTFVQIILPTTTQQSWVNAGAIVEPYSNDTTNAAETDNRLYGLQCGGTLNLTTVLTTAGTAMFSHSVSATAIHGGLFTPNAGTLIVGGTRATLATAPTAAALQDPSGVYVGDLIDFAVGAAADGNRMGTLRGIYRAGLVQSGRYLRNGATDLYHFVSMSNIGAAQGIMLPAVP